MSEDHDPWKQCDGCDKLFSGKYPEFADGYCRMYERKSTVPDNCRHYQPTPPSRYADET